MPAPLECTNLEHSTIPACLLSGGEAGRGSAAEGQLGAAACAHRSPGLWSVTAVPELDLVA